MLIARAPCSRRPQLCQGEAGVGVGVEQGGRLPVYLSSRKQAGALLPRSQSLKKWSSPSMGLWEGA